MADGTIKKIVSDRGFGFIAGADGSEYFFHRDGVDNFDSLRGGESVTFNVESSPKGPRASQVRVTQ
jgi:CspA family cold shock protein